MLLKHWLGCPSFVRRPVRARARRRDAADRSVPQCVEHLEDRCLLSAVGGAAAAMELPSFQVDTSSHSESHILVRFKEGAQLPAEIEGGELMRGTNLHKVRVGQGTTVAQAVAAFQRRPDVLFAQPDYTLHILGHETPADATDDGPNDALYANGGFLWGLTNTGKDEQGNTLTGTAGRDIDAAAAWHVTRGSRSVVVAVIDTGVDYTHPDLQANIWVNSAEQNGIAGEDDDGNGYVDDIHGWDFYNNDNDPLDDHGHGSHVAGTIGAVGNNNRDASGNETSYQALVGVNWQVSIMGLKFLGKNGSGSSSNAIKALDYAVANGAKISNNSWGGGGYDQALEAAIQRAADRGHLFVAAAGNGDFLGRAINNDESPNYPSSYQPTPDTVMAIAATDRYDEFASWSNYGAKSVDLAAPGVGIWSTIPISLDTSDGSPDGYARYSGTSMATPHVAGAAALIRSANPDLTAMQVKDLILHNVDDLSGQPATVTNGRLNVYRALVAPAAPTDLLATAGDESVSLQWSSAMGAASYNVYRSTSPDSSYQDTPLATVSASTDTTITTYTYTDTGLTGGVTYYYYVTAVSDGNESGRSSEVSATPTDSTAPAAPTGLTATAGDSKVSLDWADNSESDLTAYNIYRGTTSGSYGVDPIATVTSSAYTDTGPTNDTTYYYVVTAVDTSGNESGPSSEVSATPVESATPTMHVGDLDGTRNLKGKSGKWEALVSVLIVDQSGVGVGSATVAGTWTGAISGSVSGTTGSDGKVTFSTGTMSSGTSVTFTVESVTHASLTYSSGDNLETTITVNKDGTTSASSTGGGHGQTVLAADTSSGTNTSFGPSGTGSGQADRRVVERNSAGTSTAPSSSQSTSTGTGTDGGADGPDSAGNQESVETRSSPALDTLDGVFADSLLADALLSV